MGADVGLIFGAIGLAIGAIAVMGVLILALRGLLGDAVLGARSARRAVRGSRRRKQELADERERARAELIKLGEEIEALDIDSSMPAASHSGKDEYANAIDCYQEADRRLRNAGDDYQLERAVDALKRGREHARSADQLFNRSFEVPASPTSAAALTANQSPSQADGVVARLAARLGGRHDIVDELAKLASLHENGALTDSEFEHEKQKRLAP